MNIFPEAQAHEEAGEQGGIQANLHIDPADHALVNHEAKFYFTFTDPDKLFKLENCNCKIFIFKGDTIIDQRDVSVPTGFFASFGSYPLYTHTFNEAGDYSLHFSGQPKPGSNFDVFALHFDFHIYEANARTIAPTDHSVHFQHHALHAVIFGGGLVAAIVLFIYGLLEKRRLKNKEPKNLAN